MNKVSYRQDGARVFLKVNLVSVSIVNALPNGNVLKL